jgi:hypothetical protein
MTLKSRYAERAKEGWSVLPGKTSKKIMTFYPELACLALVERVEG